MLVLIGLKLYFPISFNSFKKLNRHSFSSFPSRLLIKTQSLNQNFLFSCCWSSKTVKMSQTPSSSNTTISTSSSDQDSGTISSCLDSDVLEISSHRKVGTNPTKVKELRTRHAGKSQASASGNPSHPSSSVPPEIANREGSAYVNQAIAKIVSRILNENHSVPGISVPLNQESSNAETNPDVSKNVETSNKEKNADIAHKKRKKPESSGSDDSA